MRDTNPEEERGGNEVKALIWIGCILGYSLIVTGLASGGILLGALPTLALGGGMYALGRYLCKKYEESQLNKIRAAKSEDDLGYMPQQETTPDEETSTPAILYCRKCGKRLIDGSDFCSYCGTSVVRE